MKLLFIGKLAIITVIHHGGGAVNAPPLYLKPVPMAKPIAQTAYQPVAPMRPIAPPAPAPPPVPLSFPVAPIGTYANTYAFGNCTAYVASRKNIPNSWGNASTWALRAAAQGITVSNVPLIGAIAQKTGGLGHVAIVEAVGDGTVTVSEANVLGLDIIDTRTYPVATFQYIYV